MKQNSFWIRTYLNFLILQIPKTCDPILSDSNEYATLLKCVLINLLLKSSPRELFLYNKKLSTEKDSTEKGHDTSD